MVNKLRNSVTGTNSLDLRESGSLTGILVSGMTTTATASQAEVSFNSTAQFAVTDATGVLATIELGPTIGQTANVFIQCDEPIDAGERVYLHTSGGVYSATLFTRPSGTPTARVPARRR